MLQYFFGLFLVYEHLHEHLQNSFNPAESDPTTNPPQPGGSFGPKLILPETSDRRNCRDLAFTCCLGIKLPQLGFHCKTLFGRTLPSG